MTGVCQYRVSKSADAARSLAEAVDLYRHDRPADDGVRVDATRWLGRALLRVGDGDGSAAAYREVVGSDRRTAASVDVYASDLRDFGKALDRAGDAAGAAAPLRTALDLRKKNDGPADGETVAVGRVLAAVLAKVGRADDAAAVRAEVGLTPATRPAK